MLATLPLPGEGNTLARWRYLAAQAAIDASRARLAEGHLDAIAILQELGRGDLLMPGQRWGVWAAEPSDLQAVPTRSGWQLRGRKRWCSGSVGLDAALVTATCAGAPLLFALPTQRLGLVDGSWRPLGMAGTASHTLTFDLELPAENQVGGSGAYVERAGFWHGGAGVAVCWYGVAVGVAQSLAARSGCVADDVYTAAATGHARAGLEGIRALLRAAADDIDRSPGDVDAARRRAMGIRVAVEGMARGILESTIAVLGASALCHDQEHMARIADLTVYLGQHHGDRDAAAFGRLVPHPGPVL